MTSTISRRLFYSALLAAVLILGDAGLKYFSTGQSYSLSYFAITNAVNYYWLFSLKLPQLLGFGFTIIILLVISKQLFWNYQNSGFSFWGYLLILIGGGINVVERLIWGFVRDPLKIGSGNWNMADIYILVGLLIVFFSFKSTDT